MPQTTEITGNINTRELSDTETAIEFANAVITETFGMEPLSEDELALDSHTHYKNYIKFTNQPDKAELPEVQNRIDSLLRNVPGYADLLDELYSLQDITDSARDITDTMMEYRVQSKINEAFDRHFPGLIDLAIYIEGTRHAILTSLKMLEERNADEASTKYLQTTIVAAVNNYMEKLGKTDQDRVEIVTPPVFETTEKSAEPATPGETLPNELQISVKTDEKGRVLEFTVLGETAKPHHRVAETGRIGFPLFLKIISRSANMAEPELGLALTELQSSLSKEFRKRGLLPDDLIIQSRPLQNLVRLCNQTLAHINEHNVRVVSDVLPRPEATGHNRPISSYFIEVDGKRYSSKNIELTVSKPGDTEGIDKKEVLSRDGVYFSVNRNQTGDISTIFVNGEELTFSHRTKPASLERILIVLKLMANTETGKVAGQDAVEALNASTLAMGERQTNYFPSELGVVMRPLNTSLANTLQDIPTYVNARIVNFPFSQIKIIDVNENRRRKQASEGVPAKRRISPLLKIEIADLSGSKRTLLGDEITVVDDPKTERPDDDKGAEAPTSSELEKHAIHLAIDNGLTHLYNLKIVLCTLESALGKSVEKMSADIEKDSFMNARHELDIQPKPKRVDPKGLFDPQNIPQRDAYARTVIDELFEYLNELDHPQTKIEWNNILSEIEEKKPITATLLFALESLATGADDKSQYENIKSKMLQRPRSSNSLTLETDDFGGIQARK